MNVYQTLRNVAIIAHVDHGKTTLVDAILGQTGVFRAHERVDDRVLDSDPIERERGITILAKNTAVFFDDCGQAVKINIVDTPGHADFGGEVERILSMVDGALLVVDAAEGPLPQTRYVLSKALAARLTPVVVVNKIDRPDARPHQVVDEVLDLFISLDADDDQLDFPVLYASARARVAHPDLEQAQAALAAGGGDILPLLRAVVQHVPPPAAFSAAQNSGDRSMQFMVTMLDYDDYVGRIAIGRVQRGRLRQGATVLVGRPESQPKRGKIATLYTFERLLRVAVPEVGPGEIAAIAGIDDIEIGETITDPEAPEYLPPLSVDEPTLTVIFRINDSPLAGQDGSYVTSRHLRERLWREARTNVALKVSETDSPDAFLVAGRGELHLGILIETMRRDGFEFAVSKPRVITKTIDGVVHEPIELVTVDVPQEYLGVTMEQLGARKGEMIDLSPIDQESVRVRFTVPARGLIGFHAQFLTETKGYGILHHTFHGYAPHRGEISGRTHGSLVAWENGIVTAYACESAQERGRLFVSPGDIVYSGMVVGANNRPQDLEVNVCKKKHVTNMRSSTAEISVKLDPPRTFTVEQALAYIADDELVEVTPHHIRMRKSILDRHLRAANKKSGVSP